MTDQTPVSLESVKRSLPPPWPEDLLPEIRQRLAERGRTLVVLDDDPTGTQTVYDTPILTRWEMAEIAELFREQAPLVYLLTNSRSLSSDAAKQLAGEAARRLSEASQQTGRQFDVVSRSDSTLRGHYPGEVQALSEALGTPQCVHLLIPAFLEGGRYTIEDVHYLLQGDCLTPAAETPFARDAAFGYQNSNLKQWVAEKTAGQIAATSVRTISLQTLREGGPREVSRQLERLRPGDVCIVNAADYRDLEVAAAALLDAETKLPPMIYRTAASFVRVFAGLGARPHLRPAELEMAADGWGLTIVGSYVQLSSQQWQALRESGLAQCIELDVECLLNKDCRESELHRAATEIDVAAAAGNDVAVATSRALAVGNDAASSLAIGRQVSTALVELVRMLSDGPRYLVAKGGITSSDVATEGLGIRRAEVLGQILPGVPVWRASAGSRFPNLPYIVFPGNVGNADSLVQLISQLRESR